jgi:hypothetical protein
MPARVTTARTTRNLANLTNQEQWMGLFELVSNEHDQEKRWALFEGMLRLLEDRQVPTPPPPIENCPPTGGVSCVSISEI